MSEVIEVHEGVKRIHCSNCGAELNYSPGTQHLVCQYCNTRNEIAESAIEIRENDLLEFLNANALSSEKETHGTITCNSCGSITDFDEKISASNCPFCGNHLMLKDASRQERIKPQAILPFAIDKRNAHLKFRDWLGGLWFAPNKLKRISNSPEGMTGIYTPYWTFDAKTVSDYSGERGDDEQRPESYTVSINGRTELRQRMKTVTRWRAVSGRVQQVFDDWLVLGSDTLPADKASALQPWALNELLPFEEDYLRGFKVESYKIPLEQAFEKARTELTGEIKEAVRRDIGGDHQRIHSLDIDWQDLRFKHILLPVWIASYRYNNKSYRFLVNGKTGEVQGERPYSAWKIAFLVVAILLVLGAIYLFSK